MAVDEDEEGRSTVWWLVLAVVAVMIWAVIMVPDVIREYATNIRAGDYAGVAGAITGHTVVITFVVWAALYFLFVRRRAPERGGLYLAILFVAALATQGGVIALGKLAADKNNTQADIAKAELSKTFAHVTDPRSGPIDMNIKAQGDAGEMERITKLGAASTIASAKKYRDALAALDYPAFIGPARLAADPGLVQTKEKLRKARLAVQTFRTEINTNLANLQADVQKSNMSESSKAQFATGIAKGAAKNRQTAERTLNCEDGIFAEFDSIADVLARSKGRWVVKGRTIVFANHQDLVSYQAHISKIHQLAQEERDLVATARSSMSNMQNQLSHAD